MKFKVNALIISNIILLIAVIALFILQFSSEDKQGPKKQTSEVKQAPNDGGLMVGYINTDSVLSQYKMVETLEAKLKGEGEAMRNELKRRQENLKRKLQNYQSKVKNNNITMEEAKRTEQALMQEEEQLYKLQQEYANQYADKTMGMNQELVDTVRTFLNRYNKRYNFDYILAKSQAKNNILFAKDTFNITSSVIKQMNKEYLEQNSDKEE